MPPTQASLYGAVMAAGASTFGDAAKPNVLLNYHADDALAAIARFATGTSIVFGFPLVFSGFFDSFARLLPEDLETKLKTSKLNRAAASLVLVLATAAVTLVTSDIGLPAGLSGSILGGFVVYVLPAVVKWQSAQACTDKLTCLSLAALGIVLAYLGASQTLAQYGFL